MNLMSVDFNDLLGGLLANIKVVDLKLPFSVFDLAQLAVLGAGVASVLSVVSKLYKHRHVLIAQFSRAIASKFGGNAPAEVEAKLNSEKTGNFGGIAEIATIGGFIVQMVKLAIQIKETGKTHEQLVAALQAKSATADKISEEKRREIIQLIVERLTEQSR